MFMPKDKFNALWVSHSSISDYLACPRSYFLKNVYKDPKTGHKITLMNPHLALGQSVHHVLESLSHIPYDQRFDRSLQDRFSEAWGKVSGKQGGFFDEATESQFRKRGEEMLARAYRNPGPLKTKAVKITSDLPQFWLSEEESIILCGKIDWLEYLPESDSVNIIDFKTGKREEEETSLQLPIYHLLVHHCQKRRVTKMSYWYLERNDFLTEQPLPDLEDSGARVLRLAQKMKVARQLGKFNCKEQDGCFACLPMEHVINGKAQYVGNDEYRRDVYVLETATQDINSEDSVVL